MKKLSKRMGVFLWLCVIAVLLIASLSVPPPMEEGETVQVAMRDAVLHDVNQIDFLGGKAVNPGFISGLIVSGTLLVAAALIRIFAIPRFRYVPGRFQMAIEMAVGLFRDMASSNSPHRNRFLGAYVFGAGVYIFTGTLFELLGLQGITTHGFSIALPAPLADINGAIMMGVLSYFVILSGGIAGNGLRGAGNTLKDFSLMISLSFRLYGALLSGLLVTELVYYYVMLSFVLPVVIGVIFTLLHALIQAYVLTTLTTVFYGEVSEPPHHHKKDRQGA